MGREREKERGEREVDRERGEVDRERGEVDRERGEVDGGGKGRRNNWSLLVQQTFEVV